MFRGSRCPRDRGLPDHREYPNAPGAETSDLQLIIRHLYDDLQLDRKNRARVAALPQAEAFRQGIDQETQLVRHHTSTQVPSDDLEPLARAAQPSRRSFLGATFGAGTAAL